MFPVIILRSVIACALAGCGALASAPAIAGEVSITVSGVRGDAGPLQAALQTEDQFMRPGQTASAKVDEPQAGAVVLTVPDVPPGRYAITIWHDIDGDGNFSMGPAGPTDGWSMVGARDLRGPPTFAGHSVEVGSEPTEVAVEMIYPDSPRR